MLTKIQAYEAQIAENPATFFPPCCPVCQVANALRKHELRRRGFWFVLSNEVMRVASFVLRVACKSCNRRSTLLPDFALPHKRYVRSDTLEASERYLLDDTATYETATEIEGRPVFHNTDGACRPRSTVHRWIDFFGSLLTLLSAATELALEADPAFSPVVEMVPISLRRYRSETRRTVLERAHRLLRVRACLLRATGCDLFPRFATAAAWR